MRKKFELTDFGSWLGPDASRLWATSYTVDEHQAFAIAYRVLGGRVPSTGVHLRFQRSGFRRAGQGVMPRGWLNPFSVPAELPLPSYHPKLILAERGSVHALVVSTGNLAQDDMCRTRNLAVRFDVRPAVAKRVSQWIERPLKSHRALCLVVAGEKVGVKKPATNASTLSQFVEQLERCPACKKARLSRGSWVVAAPFWSPGALVKMADLEPDGSVEAYFRARSVWEQVALRAAADSTQVRLDRVHAHELRQNGDLPRWHHKVVGWRCCAGRSARAALYLGSANATVCGFFGKGERAVNWEAGVIWTGGAAVWERARSLARAGFSAVKLGPPKGAVDPNIGSADELGTTDTDEIERMFAAHVERRIRVYRRSRSIGLGSGGVVRVLGHSWRLDKVRLRFEDQSAVKDAGVLVPGKRLSVPEGARPQVHAVFTLELPAGKTSDPEVPPYAETTLDLVDLDPEPELPPPTRQSAITAALAGLWGPEWGGSQGHGGNAGVPEHGGAREDVRFPFAELFALGGRRPHAAIAWLDRISGNAERALEPLPKFWPRLAEVLRKESDW